MTTEAILEKQLIGAAVKKPNGAIIADISKSTTNNEKSSGKQAVEKNVQLKSPASSEKTQADNSGQQQNGARDKHQQNFPRKRAAEAPIGKKQQTENQKCTAASVTQEHDQSMRSNQAAQANEAKASGLKRMRSSWKMRPLVIGEWG